MQGRRSAVGSVSDSINFNYGSTSSNMGIDQQICWNNRRNAGECRLPDYQISNSNSDVFMDRVGQEGKNWRRWSIGESSSSSLQNEVSCAELMTQSGLSSSMNTIANASLRLEEHRYEPANLVFQTDVDLSLSSNPVINGPAFVRSSNSGSAFQNYDMNERQFHGVGEHMDCPNSSKSQGFESKVISSASSSSDPSLSFGSVGIPGEEDDGQPGCSLNGRRLSCKRKTLEGNGGPSSSDGGSFSRADGGVHAVPLQYNTSVNVNAYAVVESSSNSPPEQVNPILGLGMHGGLSAESFDARSAHGGLDSSHKNYCLRMNPSIQLGSMSNNSSLPVPTSAAGHLDMPVHQPFRFVNPPLDLLSPIPPDDSAPQNQSVILRVPTLWRNMQAVRWNVAPNLRPESSSSSAVPGERDAALTEDLNPINAPRSIAEHVMLVPPVDPRDSAENPMNWSLNGGNVGISRSIASSAPSSGSHNSSGPSWVSHHHPPQCTWRISEYVRRSLLSSIRTGNGGHSIDTSQHRSRPVSSQEFMISPGVGNQGHSHSHSRSALWLERQGGGAVGIPYFLRALAAASEGRSRLVSEDVMILDQSVFLGMADSHDQHRDMRLDVDNMSYEELLALEERIGNVCTGLSEETILKFMKQRKYVHIMRSDQPANEPCCICQEEYSDGEDIGNLNCGHDFHTNCIKQWLARKNLCPICKTTALTT